MEAVRPTDLMKLEAVSKRFRSSQEIGVFLKIFKDKINSKNIPPTVFVDQHEFLSFIDYIEKFKNIENKVV